MKVDLTKVMAEHDGRPMRDGKRDVRGELIEEQSYDLTLRHALAGVCNRSGKDDENRSLDQLLKLGAIAVEIGKKDTTTIELSAEEITTLVERAPKVYWMAPVLVMRIVETLDPRRLPQRAPPEPEGEGG